MKLIRCYIENFGGLQQYTVDFNDGLTVIHEPNGFGKTTLAEFIRAMFYGFPKGVKIAAKNPRLKYLPWQGGRYGGYLIFELEGKRYRIDRSFGDAPKGDKFKLFDESTHKEVKDFGPDIGLAIFGLDSDSFIRSTYMPQIRDSGPMTTDNIRAKLGNLLEDTGDLGSYEKALQKLKDKRTVYEHYRGSGGSIHEAQKKISALQQEITLCQAKEPRLEAVTAELTESRQAQALGESALQHIRRQLSEATTAEAEAALSREYESLCKTKNETEQALTDLQSRYPKGIPTAAELEAVSRAMDKYAALEGQLQETQADRAAAQTAADNRARFHRGTPTAEDFAPQVGRLDRLMTAGSELHSAVMSSEEAEELTRLEKQFSHGIPEETMLNQCSAYATELTGLQHTRPTLELPMEDKARLEKLDSYFAANIPQQAVIDRAEEQLNRADSLRRENLRLSAAVPTEPATEAVPQKKFHSLFFPALILGILAAAAGIYLLITPAFDSHMAVGGICAALGLAAVIAAAMLQNNHSLMAKLQSQVPVGTMTAAQRSMIEENEAAAAAVEREVTVFLAAYPARPEDSLRSRLGELNTNRALYLPLRDRREALRQQAMENDARTEELTEALHKALSPYFDTIVSFDTAAQTLRRRIEQYDALSRKQRELTARREALTEEIAALEEGLSAFLLQYGVKAAPAEYRRALDTLRREADSYTAALSHLQHRAAALAERDEECAALRKAQEDFCAAYGLTISIGDRQALKAAERDGDAINRLQKELTLADKALTAFVAEHGHRPASQEQQTRYDLAGLQAGERELIRKQNALHADILRLEQQIRLLRADIDRIPQLTDELTRLTEQKAADTEARQLLDSTVDYLQKARESLSASYLGGVQGHFARYLNRLTGEDTKHIAVNTDLEVQLERGGSNRPLNHFSAGQTDAVHLCMRLALSDALFEEGSTFMILDDPFVNLDDRHTAQALELLQELAQDRQIIYLVCNSSRSI
ncbi:MAG: AAA family ATPase [Oscillospiraceae bacterium]|nr:AAA family ATPase [Oscillospiraceae bacterium]